MTSGKVVPADASPETAARFEYTTDKEQAVGHRAPDAHNPEGYFECEEIKHLAQRPEIILQAAGKAVKVVSPLLASLPSRHRYKVIFMTRPAAEIARSQRKMRMQLEAASPSADAMHPLLARHAEDVLSTLRGARNVELLVVDYPALVAQPVAECARVADFLGREILPRPDSMPGAVAPKLYRERDAKP